MAGPQGLAAPRTVGRHGGRPCGRFPILACLHACLLVSACGGHLPSAPPAPQPPARFSEAPAHPSAAPGAAPLPADPATRSDSAWWQAFGDPRLDTLQQQALADHPGLAQAQARVARARALADLAQAEGRPLLALTAGASRQAGPLLNDAGSAGAMLS